jgi:hypothetical protein
MRIRSFIGSSRIAAFFLKITTRGLPVQCKECLMRYRINFELLDDLDRFLGGAGDALTT